MKHNAIWFSRHAPTQAQLDDLKLKGYRLLDVERGMALGNISINDENTARQVVEEINRMASDNEAHACFGVFPVPIQHEMTTTKTTKDYYLACHASWNVNRSKEGEKPSFEHKQFLYVGDL